MTYKVLFLDEAREDVKEAIYYYRSLIPGLALRFKCDLSNIVSILRNRPKTFGFRFKEFRTANLNIFPYQVHYKIEEENHCVIVFAVLHGYRDPEFVRQRI